MPYLLGTDEAGYGPNLGPLLVAASLWHVADEEELDLYVRLKKSVTAERKNAQDRRLVLADSKQLYQSGGDWKGLESGLFSLLRLLGEPPTTMRALWNRLAPEDHAANAWPLWRREFDCDLPRHTDAAECAEWSENAARELQDAGVRLVAIRCRALFPAEFNAACEKLGNKSTALSHATLELASGLIAEHCDGPVAMSCDKHGGRNKYCSLLQQFFPDHFVEVHEEGRDRSRYAWGPPERRVRAEFQARGERWLPSAVASMAAKYLREVAMLAFNDFWLRELPGLRPTAGYPGDASRFRGEIAVRQRELGICDAQLWRER